MSKNIVHNKDLLLVGLLEQEEERNKMLQERFKAALKKLPWGKLYVRSVPRKKVEAKKYVYLSRYIPEKKSPESKYIGIEGSVAVKKIQAMLADREKLKNKLEALKIEKKMIQKAMNEYQRLCQ